jgi:hypothetical protein
LHRTPRLHTLALPLLGALLACAGPDVAKEPASSADAAGGRRIQVGLYDAKGEIRLDLANEGHPELAGIYSRQLPDATLKLAPEALMDDLVQDLGRLSFAALSVTGDPPSAGAAVRGWVTVEANDSRRTFIVPASGASAEQLQAFSNMKLLINEYYTHVGGLQFVTNPQGHDIFRGPK